MQLIESWAFLECCFQSVYGIDLEEVLRVKSWRWFSVRVRGLLMTDTPLSALFTTETEPPPMEDDRE